MDIIIIGRGGFSYVVEEEMNQLNDYNVIGYMDSSFKNSSIIDEKYHLSMFDTLTVPPDVHYFIAIGNNSIRKKIIDELNINNERFISIVSVHAIVSPTVKLGYGSYIGAGVIVNANTTIGNHTIINTNATIEHDCNIGDFCLINTSSTLYSQTKIENDSVVKVGSTIVLKQPE
ncbi:acetyltransferase [Macrococcus equipercicus]|uniref:Acetyltransferase n=1 Tax=Macrococcus equipercicus TaxID=69967 RepID=A0ABQ6R862_9STAP|nr:acetyltransferase [Macrococcus equipercicus]KAA1039303.1 acetyltransferase [Macrococcus equipercicus]